MTTSTAIAHPNIAFIKYWGNRDERLRLPANGSISMNLDGLFTRTQVAFDSHLDGDKLILNDASAPDETLQRVRTILDEVRRLSGVTHFARVESRNNFPSGVGIASSASAFAALSLAASAAAGLELSEAQLSRLARLGSGSACRSVPAGFVEWLLGTGDLDSYAVSIASPDHWKLIDCVTVISREHKITGSTEGHRLAATSPLQEPRVADAPRRLDLCRQAILARDFDALARVVELDSHLMHAVMMTSTPALLYWEPATLTVMHAVRAWRGNGLPVCYTIDAGPNVHVLCEAAISEQIAARLNTIDGVQEVLVAGPGGPAHLEA